MLYEPRFEAEVRELIRVVKSKVNEKAYVHDLENTKALSRFYLFSIFELVEGAFGALHNRSLIACFIVGRSLVEYLIDLKFIILKNDKEINSLFANYHKLRIFWTMPHMVMEEYFPLAEKSFKNYVESRFSDELATAAKKASKRNSDKWEEVSTILRSGKRFGAHWSGESFYDRVEYCKDEHLRRTGEELDYPIKEIMFYYSLFSQYTHPSPFSIAPQFAGIDGSFLSKREYGDDKLEDEETFLFRIVAYSAQIFAEALDAPFDRQLNTFVETQVNHSQKLSAWLYDRK